MSYEPRSSAPVLQEAVPEDFDEPALLATALGLAPSKLPELEKRLNAIGGLRGFVFAGVEALDGLLTPGQAGRAEAWLSVLRLARSPLVAPKCIATADDVANMIRPVTDLLPVETYWTVSLNARNECLGCAHVSTGTLTSALVHPREVFAPAIRARAAQVIVVHNHPSGQTAPSGEDLRLTRRMISAGEILGIPVLDSIVVSHWGHQSIMQAAKDYIE